MWFENYNVSAVVPGSTTQGYYSVGEALMIAKLALYLVLLSCDDIEKLVKSKQLKHKN
jgi:hypothetical protein